MVKVQATVSNAATASRGTSGCARPRGIPWLVLPGRAEATRRTDFLELAFVFEFVRVAGALLAAHPLLEQGDALSQDLRLIAQARDRDREMQQHPQHEAE